MLKKRIKILKAVSLFADTDEQVLEQISHLFTEVNIEMGNKVFSKGDKGDALFIIVEGKIQIHDGDYIFTELAQDQFFGEFSLFDTQIRSASATAMENSTLLKLNQVDFFSILQSKVEVTREILKSIVKRLYDKDALEEELAAKNSEIRQQKEEIETQRDEIEAQRDEIELQRDQVVRQRDEIAKQQKEIKDSIRYASRIQNAVLPPDDSINKVLNDYFILYMPRDIVSGDFYWIKQIINPLTNGELLVIAAADCTGHGVPGAFMSMLGISLLNEIVSKYPIDNAAQILNYLKTSIISALNQTGKEGEAQDGMDMALCLIDYQNNILHFAGANNPLIFIREKGINTGHSFFELTEIKGDKLPIGISIKVQREFTNHAIEFQKNDTFYLYTDGYIDQFGGETKRKFLSKTLRDLLQTIQTENMTRQKRILFETIKHWMGFDHDQIDDILVIGVRL